MTIFTVKWVYTLDGIERERVLEADQVNIAWDNRAPGNEPKTSDGPKLGIYGVPQRGGIVVLGNPEQGSDSMALTFGKVYVMNRDGKTVAKYDLGEPCIAQGSDGGVGKPTPRLAA